MKIYIYGNQSFKKEIHQTLEHSNIKFKIDSNLEIEEINNLSKLKQTITENPQDIYLIDDEKIIKKNSLNKKIKFFIPKDGIEEEFLIESGISELSIDSIKELPKYIIRKYQELKENEPIIQEIKETDLKKVDREEDLDDELSQLLEKGHKESLKIEELDTQKDINLDDIDDFISNLDDTEVNELNNFQDGINFNDDFGLNNISYDYDDDDIISKEETLSISEEEIEEFDFLDKPIIENEEDEDFSVLSDLNLGKDFDFLNEQIEETRFEQRKEIEEDLKQTKEALQGEKMNDEFFELDSINEKDLLDALNYQIDDKVINHSVKSSIEPSKEEILTINSSNANDLSQLISKLLTNKTLEITIKIKD